MVEVVVSVGVAALLALWWRGRGAGRTSLAAALGLRYERGGWLEPDALSGEVGGVGLRVTMLDHRLPTSEASSGRISAGGPPTGLRIVARGVATRLGSRPSAAVTGDTGFDREILVEGDPAHLAAALDLETRRAVRHVVAAYGGHVADGLVELEARFDHVDPADLRAKLEILASATTGLSVPEAEIPARLCANAARDPEPGVRRRCLRVLHAVGPAALAGTAARAALADEDALVRAQAAILLDQPDAVPTSLLGALAAEDPDGVAGALGRSGDEERLCGLLAEDGARVAAAEVLARIGTARAVAPLLALQGGLLGDEAVKAAARDALGHVRARLVGVEPGRLTLAETAPEAGAVSLASSATRAGRREGERGA